MWPPLQDISIGRYELVKDSPPTIVVTEGNIFTGVCLSTASGGWVSLVPCPFQRVGISGSRSIPGGVGMSRGWVCQGGGGYPPPILWDTVGKWTVRIPLEFFFCFRLNYIHNYDFIGIRLDEKKIVGYSTTILFFSD